MTGDNIVKRNIGQLLYGRTDAYLEDKDVAMYMAKDMGVSEQVKVAGRYGDPIVMYIGFSPKNHNSQQYAKLLSEGIRAMRASGRLQQILDKYGVSDWKDQLPKTVSETESH